MHKPIILIDFDGVFNILDEYEDVLKDWDDAVLVTIPYDGDPDHDEFTVIVRKSIVDYFVKLAALDIVDIYWLTTWVKNTEKFPEYLGLPVLPWLERAEVSSEWDWWKLKTAKAFAETIGPGTPVLWVDDDHGYDSSAIHWLLTVQRNWRDLAPSSREALHPKDIEKISAFVKEHTGVEIGFEG